MSTNAPTSFETRNDPPAVEPILVAAVVFLFFVFAILTLLVAS